MTDKLDDLQRLYEEASAMEDGQPAPSVRAAVLGHAAMLAESRTGTATKVTATAKRAANWPHWKTGLVASVLLGPLLGILMLHLQEAPQPQEQVAAVPNAQTPVASQLVTDATPEPTTPAPTETAVAKMAKSTAPVAPATLSAPAPLAAPAAPVAAAAAAASPTPTLELPAVQGKLGAAAGAENRADRAEAVQSRSRETTSVASGLAAATAPAMARAAAPAKGLAGARSTPQQTTEFLLAVQQGNLPLVQALVNQGASVQAKDAQGRTALMLATIGGHAAVVKRLLDWGADRSATDPQGLTALQHAQQLGFADVVALLQ